MGANSMLTVSNPTPWSYYCNTQIYWNAAYNKYREIFKKKQHICSNIAGSNKKIASTTTARPNIPIYYKKGYWTYSNSKPKMEDSLRYSRPTEIK